VNASVPDPIHGHLDAIHELPPLPSRLRDSHKGTFGTVVVVGGSCGGAPHSPTMLGAPALAGLAALRAGCGLVKLCVPTPLIVPALALCPSATGLPIPVDAFGAIEPHLASAAIDRAVAEASCIVIGPGLGSGPGADAAALRAIQQDEVALVIDADAINALGNIREFMRDFRAAAIFTPHPGEFKRLVAALGLGGDLGLAQSREGAAQQLAQRLGSIVVLKGVGTVVTDGHRVWTNTIDHPCLATGGTGDVLSGLIGGLIAQFVPTPQQMLFKAKVAQMPTPPGRPLDLYDAARIAVCAHGVAAQMWAESHRAAAGLIATELCELLPAALELFRTTTPRS